MNVCTYILWNDQVCIVVVVVIAGIRKHIFGLTIQFKSMSNSRSRFFANPILDSKANSIDFVILKLSAPKSYCSQRMWLRDSVIQNKWRDGTCNKSGSKVGRWPNSCWPDVVLVLKWRMGYVFAAIAVVTSITIVNREKFKCAWIFI